MMKKWRLWLILACAGSCALGAGCDAKDEARPELRIFLADALARPFRALGDAFRQEHPEVELTFSPSGSVLAARKLTDANDQCDVLAVADYLVIDELLRPDHADWYICFASSEVVIVYTDASQGASELTQDNWFRVLTRDGVTVAAANPRHDPCGYWTELCWRLADLHYPADARDGSIAEAMTAKCGPPEDRRSDAQQMLQLVESAGGVDYAFAYRSQAMMHNMSFLGLPPQINLGDMQHVLFYRQVSIELPGRHVDRPILKRGDAIVYAITIPKDARRPELAATFVRFLLSEKGRDVLKAHYVAVLDEPFTFDPDRIPAGLEDMVRTRERKDYSSSYSDADHDE